jgi:hypothetical protein
MLNDASGKPRTNNLKKCQYSNGNNSSIYALDRARGGVLAQTTAQHPSQDSPFQPDLSSAW